jgi:hypothetical protein
MRQFWKFNVRYRLARRLIHAGLWVMPEGRYKSELLACLWLLYDKGHGRSRHRATNASRNGVTPHLWCDTGSDRINACE